MPTWKELERSFHELEEPLKFARLDYQGGSAGEYWRLAGSFDRAAAKRFEIYSQIAGQKLSTQQTENSRRPATATNTEHWYYHLLGSPFYQSGNFAYEVHDDGTRGLITGGTVSHPAAASATQCLEMFAMTGEEDTKQLSSISINATGNARVNVGSVDNSINLSESQIHVFERARDTIEKSVPPGAQGPLLEELEKLKGAAKTPSYSERYKAFVKTAGDHAKVLGPVLAALAIFL